MNRTETLERVVVQHRTFLDPFKLERQRQRERQLDELERVRNNLGVYFLFCLFGLAILALFLCRSSMQALQTSLFFFVLGCQVWQVFMYQ